MPEMSQAPDNAGAWRVERNPVHNRTRYLGAAEDEPDPAKHMHLDEGESKVEEKSTPQRHKYTTIFTFNKEDHTLGNLLSQRLLTKSYVTFAAYRMEDDPSVHRFELRVTTYGSVKPRDAVKQCCKDVNVELEQLKEKFKQEWAKKRIATQGEDGREDADRFGEEM